jgi:hypothetical protein
MALSVWLFAAWALAEQAAWHYVADVLMPPIQDAGQPTR